MKELPKDISTLDLAGDFFRAILICPCMGSKNDTMILNIFILK